jgi:hypothetical protein
VARNTLHGGHPVWRNTSLAWGCAVVAAWAGVLITPARAEHGDPPRGLGRDERSALLARSWRAPQAVAQGNGGDVPRLLLEPGGTGRASLRLQLDSTSSLSLRLRRDRLTVAYRRQF